ncbi:NACHT domain-containing protein [Streptomyces sp. NPDC087437]|uniref:NACHT domain-containing protein n=1 Tax=Streptomyces sp. NPDC087437 TaxID=3365789 RepID=UPI0037FD1199
MPDTQPEFDPHLVVELARAWETGSLAVVLGPEFDRETDDTVRTALLAELGRADESSAPPLGRLTEEYLARFGRAALITLLRTAGRPAVPGETPARPPSPSEALHEWLAARPPACLLVTSLYPTAEHAYRRFRRPFHVVKTETAIAFWDTAQPQIVHLFGCLDAPQDALLGERERRAARFLRPLLTARLADLPAAHTLVLVGFAPYDPVLEELLAPALHSLGAYWRGAVVVLPEADEGVRAAYGRRQIKVVTTDGAPTAAYTRDLLDLVRGTAERQGTEALRGESPAIRECEEQLGVLGWSAQHSVRLSDRAVESVFGHPTEPGPLTAHIVEGELSGGDVRRLAERVGGHGRGMAVTETRISNTARRLAATDGRLELHTRQSLLERVLGVEPYLRWILDEYENGTQRGAYVDLQCRRPLSDAVAPVRGDAYWLDDYVDSWLRERSHSQLTLLGEPGSGKSWYCRHLAYALARRCLDDPDRGRVPVLALLSEMPATGTLEDFLIAQMRGKGAELLGGTQSFRYANDTGRLVVILDGLDELRWQVTPERARRTLAELADLVGPRSKILLASRPGYFEQDRSAPRPGDAPGAPMSGSAPEDTAGVPGLRLSDGSTFEVIRLADLGYEQRVQALVRRLGTRSEPVRRLIDASSALTDLARLPGLLDLMSVVLAVPGREAPTTASELFEEYVTVLLGGAERVAVDGAAVRADTDRLAALAGRMRSRATHALPLAEARGILGVPEPASAGTAGPLSTDPRWEAFLRVAADGTVRFRLKTMREFLTARSLCTALRAGDRAPLDERLLLPEPVGYLAEQLASAGLSPLDWLPPGGSAPAVREPAAGPVGSLVGGRLPANCLSLANRMGVSLAGRSLRGLDLRGADLQGARLAGADLRDCDLRSVLLQGAVVTGADLRGAWLHGAMLHETQVVSAVGMLPDDGEVVAGTAEGLVQVLDRARLDTLESMRCPGVFRNMALMSHGRYVVAAALDGGVYLADRENGQAFLEIAHHGAPTTSAVAVGDTRLASGGTDGSVRLWTLDGDEVWQTRVSSGYVRSLALDPDVGLMFAGSSAGTVAALDAVTGRPVRQWVAHPDAGVYCLCALPGTGLVASGSDDRTIRLFVQDDGSHAADLAVLGDTVLGLVYDAGTGVLYCGCRDGTLSSWDLRHRERNWSVGGGHAVLSVALHAKSGVVATAGADGWVRLFDSGSGEPLGERLVGRRSEPDWHGVDLRGTTGWHREWLRFMGERGAILDD